MKALPWLCFSHTKGQIDGLTPSLHHKMSSHYMFNAAILSAVRQGQEEVLRVQVLGVSRQRPSFESLKKGIVCFHGNSAHNKAYFTCCISVQSRCGMYIVQFSLVVKYAHARKEFCLRVWHVSFHFQNYFTDLNELQLFFSWNLPIWIIKLRFGSWIILPSSGMNGGKRIENLVDPHGWASLKTEALQLYIFFLI